MMCWAHSESLYIPFIKDNDGCWILRASVPMVLLLFSFFLWVLNDASNFLWFSLDEFSDFKSYWWFYEDWAVPVLKWVFKLFFCSLAWARIGLKGAVSMSFWYLLAFLPILLDWMGPFLVFSSPAAAYWVKWGFMAFLLYDAVCLSWRGLSFGEFTVSAATIGFYQLKKLLSVPAAFWWLCIVVPSRYDGFWARFFLWIISSVWFFSPLLCFLGWMGPYICLVLWFLHCFGAA